MGSSAWRFMDPPRRSTSAAHDSIFTARGSKLAPDQISRAGAVATATNLVADRCSVRPRRKQSSPIGARLIFFGKTSPISARSVSGENNLCNRSVSPFQLETVIAPIWRGHFQLETADLAQIGEVRFNFENGNFAPIGEVPSMPKRALQSARFHPARNGHCTTRRGSISRAAPIGEVTCTGAKRTTDLARPFSARSTSCGDGDLAASSSALGPSFLSSKLQQGHRGLGSTASESGRLRRRPGSSSTTLVPFSDTRSTSVAAGRRPKFVFKARKVGVFQFGTHGVFFLACCVAGLALMILRPLRALRHVLQPAGDLR